MGVRRIILALVLALSIFASSCDKKGQKEGFPPRMPDSPLNGNRFEPIEFQVYDVDGRLKIMKVSGDVPICVMATWCPYSLQLKDILKSKEISPFLDPNEVIFLFSKREWDYIKQQTERESKENGLGYTDEEISNILDSKRASLDWSYLFDPNFITDLPGKIYLFDENSVFPEVNEVPAFLSVQAKAFNVNFRDWLIGHSVPLQVEADLFNKYKPRNDETAIN